MEMNRRRWSMGLAAVVAGMSLSIAEAAPAEAAPPEAEAEASLIAAARAGDGAAVEALLDGAVDVNASETGGMTALHWAVQARRGRRRGPAPRRRRRCGGAQPLRGRAASPWPP